MKTTILALAAAWLTVSAGLGLLLFVFGQNPLAGLPHGWVGVLGAGGYALAHRAIEQHRVQGGFDEEVAQAFLSAPREAQDGFCCEAGAREFPGQCPWHEPVHEGLRRMHADIRRDAERDR